MEKFYNTNLEEQETYMHVDIGRNMVSIYTCRKITYNKLKQKLGEPTKKYYINKQISGASWEIPSYDKKKLTSILSRRLLIGDVGLKKCTPT